MTDLAEGYLPAIVLLVIGFAILLLVGQRIAIPMDAREPPLIIPKIPFVSHLIGLMRHQTDYFQQLSDKSQLPAFTIPMITAKMYVITSPPMIQAAMRAKTLSFNPLVLIFSDKLIGCDRRSMEIISSTKKDENGFDFLTDMHNTLHESLIPGPALYIMNAKVLKVMAADFMKIGPDFETKPLWTWLRNTFAIATTTAIFGNKNPLANDPALIQKFWDFETDALQLMTRPLNFLTARKAYLAREAVQAALRAYFYAGHDLNDDVSTLTKARVAVGRKWGLSLDVIGNCELAMAFVSTTNAIPTLFWMFCFVFSDPQLCDELRAEVTTIAERLDSDNCVIDITKIPHTCPLLNSVYQEVMRLTNMQTSTRFVMEDTVLEQPGYNGVPPKTVLLKKGALVQMPAGIVHVATENWGADAHEFDPRRFIKVEGKELPSTKSQVEQEKLQKKSFYPFGGGRYLCPGRQFAYAEILGAIAVLLLGYDITDANGNTTTVPPRSDKSFNGVKKPPGRNFHMQVRVRRKPEWERVTWAFRTE